MSLLRELSRELGDLVARAAPAVVGLGQGRAHGSGMVVSPDGYVLTNAHVVRSADALRVRLSSGPEASAELVGADERTDLAVVRTEARGLDALELAEARPLRRGELVVAIGNPWGLERSVSLGVVSALHRDLPTRDGVLEGLIQTDAPVNPGHSGGPLLDAEGAVVGVTTAMLPYARGIGFAVPARTAGWVAAVLIQHGEVRRPYLGIVARSEELPASGPRDQEPRWAVRVLRVEPGTPAEWAGLRGQDLLLAADGRALGGLDDLQRALVLSTPPEVRLQVARDGRMRELCVRPRPAGRAA